MKVLGFIGSPRRDGNTDLAVSRVLEGAAARSNAIEKVYLYDFEIASCLDCRGCKNEPHRCVLKDGMQQLYPKLEDADVVIFGTPLYWYGPSAKMKLFFDRLRPFIASEKLHGKKAILVAPSEEGAEACRFLVGMFELSFEYLGVAFVGKFLPTASERGDVAKQPQTLNEAFELGKSLGT